MRMALEPDLLLVGEAASGQQAMTLAAASLPDIIVLSVNTQEIDGKIIRVVLELLPACVPVVLSLYDNRTIREQAFAAGAAAFVSKHEPIDILLAAIRQSVGTPHDEQPDEPRLDLG